jgi:hypothetical protein
MSKPTEEKKVPWYVAIAFMTLAGGLFWYVVGKIAGIW